MKFTNMKLISSQRANFGHEEGWFILAECDNPNYQPNGRGLASAERVSFSFSIPDSAILWRQAEHNLPDLDTTLDVLMTENLIEELNPPTSEEHVARCARKKLEMRMSTRSNKSVMRAKAANPNDPTTAEEAEAPHPLAPIRSHYEKDPIPHHRIQAAQAILERAKKEMMASGNANTAPRSDA